MGDEQADLLAHQYRVVCGWVREPRSTSQWEVNVSEPDVNGTRGAQAIDPAWAGPCWMGGVAAFSMLGSAMATMVVVLTLGGEPTSPHEYFTLLARNRLVGMLRMDLASIATVGLYYFVFFGLFAALRRTQAPLAALATALAFVGATLWFARHSALSMLHLSDRHAAAATDAERAQITAAAEAVLASDVWHSTGALVGGVLLMGGAIVICVAMLKSGVFGKVAAWSGILANGFDLLHILVNLVVPGNPGDILMAVAGPAYLVWFVLLGRRLLQLARCAQREAPQQG
jgi:hypothetical protein